MKVVLSWGLGGTIEGFWVGDFKAQITVVIYNLIIKQKMIKKGNMDLGSINLLGWPKSLVFPQHFTENEWMNFLANPIYTFPPKFLIL